MSMKRIISHLWGGIYRESRISACFFSFTSFQNELGSFPASSKGDPGWLAGFLPFVLPFSPSWTHDFKLWIHFNISLLSILLMLSCPIFWAKFARFWAFIWNKREASGRFWTEEWYIVEMIILEFVWPTKGRRVAGKVESPVRRKLR